MATVCRRFADEHDEVAALYSISKSQWLSEEMIVNTTYKAAADQATS